MNDTTKEITVAEAIPLAADRDTMSKPLGAVEVRRQMGVIQDILESVLNEGVHYGKVPGVQQPFLYKAGAEKLALAFRLRAEYELVDQLLERGDGHTDLGFIDVSYRCRLYHQGTGALVGEADGNCNSRERKYKTRQVYPDKITESEKKLATLETRTKRNGGTYDVFILPVDPFEIRHTIISMAQKRAFTAAVRAALAATDVLGVDPDMAAELRGEADAAGTAAEAPVDTGAEAKRDDATKLGALLNQAAPLSRRWAGIPGNGAAFPDLCREASRGRGEGKAISDPTKLTVAEVQWLIRTMENDLDAHEKAQASQPAEPGSDG